MKAKLLKRLRLEGRNKIRITSVTTEYYGGGYELIIGMSYTYTGHEYRGLFELGDTVYTVREKAMEIFLNKNIDEIRQRYRKYSRKFKENKL